ncbi:MULTISPECIES: hypothetical protein [unclassified Rhizobium]|uniref:hypothetical protein n=1 Tax=unclassified Rhizobium TaxID=2613769 RepID=UPI00037AFA9A|nr:MULTISPECIES: hypothetical protein [unclassified Rhizobium]MDM9644495.1 hypothetical protein [Rhizobium sp. S163]
MTEEKSIKVEIDHALVWAIFFMFFLFWQQSGWYRVDCALGVNAACSLIAAEKDYREVKP